MNAITLSEKNITNRSDFSLTINSDQQLEFLSETVAQCQQIYQLNEGDWQQISRTFTLANFTDKNAAYSEINACGFRQKVRLIFDTVRQCIKLLYTEPIVWKKFN